MPMIGCKCSDSTGKGNKTTSPYKRLHACYFVILLHIFYQSKAVSSQQKQGFGFLCWVLDQGSFANID